MQEGGAYAGNGWYRVSRGFMRHACPAHADAWRAVDAADRRHEDWVGRRYATAHRWADWFVGKVLIRFAPKRIERASQCSTVDR